ncbi:MAG: hypothetical protein JWO86_3801 [Myxococcaceae bacterium]|nr:hypothetical protein [Myxococcaceae bacterium]
MSASTKKKHLRAAPSPSSPSSQAAPVSSARPIPVEIPGVVAASVLVLEGTTARLRVGTLEVTATLDPSVHPSVVATALTRHERVIAQREGDAWVVLGALRTSPTVGIEESDEYVIRAARVRIRAADEFTVASGAASFAVRAYGAVETIAEQITSRASAVHKIVGRMLHLN